MLATVLRRYPFWCLFLLFFSACRGNALLAGAEVGGTGGEIIADGQGGDNTPEIVPSGATNPNVLPFETAAPNTILRKVKALLTGQAPSEEDFASYKKDRGKLRQMVLSWMKSDDYRNIMQDFFTVQFQQSQMNAGDFAFNMYDQEYDVTGGEKYVGLRESFARTVMAINDEGRPFTDVFTTRRLMLTSRLMATYAYYDTSRMQDEGGRITRWQQPSFAGPTFQESGKPASTRDSGDPKSPTYMRLYGQKFSGATCDGDCDVSRCISAPQPYVFSPRRVFAGPGEWGMKVWETAVLGFDLFSFYPEEYRPDTIGCRFPGTGMSMFRESDDKDWRMVTLRRPQSGEHLTEFFDIDTIRSSSDLLVDGDYVSFFSTPAFLSQWGTNSSNASRAAANQTLIAALGKQIDGNDVLPLTNPTAVDSKHAAEPACFACHQALDPLTQYFRQSFSLSYSPQTVDRIKQLPAQFRFRGGVAEGNGVAGLGAALAQHPRLALAWTVKLCSWANSSLCEETDPEVLRLAEGFVQSGFKWDVLVEEMFVSPLITNAAATATGRTKGVVVSMARQRQLCVELSSRLGLDDVCQTKTASANGDDDIPSRAAALGRDAYSRGVDSPLYVTQPEPFSTGNLENICALAAQKVIDVGASSWAGSNNIEAAVSKLTTALMGLSAEEAAEPQRLLLDHYSSAVASGANRTTALRSTFVAACSSLFVSGVGN